MPDAVAMSEFKIKDMYSGSLVRVKTSEDLHEWLTSKYATLMSEQERCIDGLKDALDNGADPTWWGAACGLSIELAKKKRSRK